MIEIKFAHIHEVEKIQPVFNHKAVIGWLGGMTMLETMKQSAVSPKQGKVGLWYAEEDGQIIGAMLSGGRPMAFRMKYGSVGVLPEHRRRRISTALYTTMTIQGIWEGRRLWEDSIVGDNPFQFQALPTFGLTKVGELRHRTGSAKGLVLFDFSLLEKGSLEKMLSRIEDRDFKIHILQNNFCREVWEANMGAYAKQLPEFKDKITRLRESLRSEDWIQVTIDETDPTVARRQSQQRKLVE